MHIMITERYQRTIGNYYPSGAKRHGKIFILHRASERMEVLLLFQVDIGLIFMP